ncbi:MAG TPA: phytanoyl-CoA dioxygenase family protein [Arenimonas sp.]|nr:phytanoyl-CoA dioxygenase family protein [Arenimonas sp.]
MAEVSPTPVGPSAHAEALRRDGYLLLRGGIPAPWRDPLRAEFDAGEKPNHQWPVPRGPDWRHSLLDLSPTVQAACRLPEMLAAVGEMIGETFFLAQVEGREPLHGGGHQGLHRDLSSQRPGDTALAIVFLDNYGPANGATRLVPGSHRHGTLADYDDATQAVQLSGQAGDILVFDADLVHAGSLNATGARRRSLLLTFFAEPLYSQHLKTAHLRSVRMEAAWFQPAAVAPGARDG